MIGPNINFEYYNQSGKISVSCEIKCMTRLLVFGDSWPYGAELQAGEKLLGKYYMKN